MDDGDNQTRDSNVEDIGEESGGENGWLEEDAPKCYLVIKRLKRALAEELQDQGQR